MRIAPQGGILVRGAPKEKQTLMKAQLSFRVRFLAGTLGLFVFLILLVGFFGINRSKKILFDSERLRLQEGMISHAISIEREMDALGSQILALSSGEAIQDFMRIADRFEGDTEQYRDQELLLKTALDATLRSQSIYSQLSLMNQSGQELSLFRSAPAGPESLPKERLENRSQDPYFQEAMSLPLGAFRISDPESASRQEFFPDAESQWPTLTYSAPVLDSLGGAQGIVAAQIVVRKLFPEYAASGDFLAFDQKGRYLLHPDEGKLWKGPGDLGEGGLFGDYPAFAQIILSGRSDVLELEDSFLAYAPVFFDSGHPDRFLILARRLPKDFLAGPARALGESIFSFGLMASAILLLGLFAFSNILMRPIEQMARKAFRIGSGHFIPLPGPYPKDELGELAKALNQMGQKLHRSYADMQAEVSRKTKELEHALKQSQTQKKHLENGKKAMLRILGDMKLEKAKSEALAKDLEKFRLGVESAADQILIADSEGTVLYANPATEIITGFPLEEVIGKKAGGKELWGGLMEEDFYRRLWRTLNVEKKVFDGRLKNRKKSGEEYYAFVSISPILNAAGEVEFFLGIQRDITKEHEIDQAKTEFVSLASHQLRTPLSTINWYSEMLLSGDAGKLNRQQREYVEQSYKGSQRMVELVNSLLNVSRLELGTFAIDPEPLNPVELMKGLLKDLQPRIRERRLAVQAEFEKKPFQMQADRKLLNMIFDNFMTNAIKYTDPEGSIKIVLRRMKAGRAVDGRKIRQDSLLFSVADTGYGIPKPQVRLVFQKLFRADNVKQRDTQGTGLGLYITKSIVDHSGGEIWFKSSLGKGSTFFVLLPFDGMRSRKGGKKLT